MRITLYVPGDTWLHRLDPMTKLLMTAVGVALTFAFVSAAGGAALLLAFLVVLGTGGVLHRAAPIFIGVAVIAFTFIIVQGLVHPENVQPLFRTGPLVFYEEGFWSGSGWPCACTTYCPRRSSWCWPPTRRTSRRRLCAAAPRPASGTW